MLVPCQPSNNRRSQRPHPRFNQHIAYQPSKPNKVGSVARRGKAAGGLAQTTCKRYPGQNRGMPKDTAFYISVDSEREARTGGRTAQFGYSRRYRGP